MSTGEGGYPDEIIPYKDHVITQVATGLFGVSEASIQRAPIVEFTDALEEENLVLDIFSVEKFTEVVAKARENGGG